MQAEMLVWRSGESQGPNPLQLGRLKSRYEIKTTARERSAHGKKRFIKNKRGWRRAMENKTEEKAIWEFSAEPIGYYGVFELRVEYL